MVSVTSSVIHGPMKAMPPSAKGRVVHRESVLVTVYKQNPSRTRPTQGTFGKLPYSNASSQACTAGGAWRHAQ